jgi:nucleoside-diphosphate-sugar epimerase
MQKGRVLVTGRGGFTGRYAAEVLAARGWDVWGLSHRISPALGPFHRAADLSDPDALTRVIEEIRPDAVLHLAGIAFVAHGNLEDIYRINLVGTRNLLGALARTGHGARGVVLASSANVYGNARQTPITEDTPPSPANDYAVSKLAMEYASKLFADDLPIVIARTFNYTGVGQDQKFLVPKIVAHFRKRAERIELGNLDVARDFSDVRDVARIYTALLESDAARGQTVNVCSGRSIALGDIIEMCRRFTGHDIDAAVNPAFVRQNEIKILRADPARLEYLLGKLDRYPFEDTLRWMLDT